MSTSFEDKSEAHLQKKNFFEAVRRGQEPLWDDPSRGLLFEWIDKDNIEKLQRKSLEQNSPISYFLDDSSYNQEIMKKTLISIIFELNELEINKDIDPIKLVNCVGENLSELIRNVLKRIPGYFQKFGENIDTSPILLSMIGGAIIQPSMIYTAANCERKYLDAWERTECPVCGRFPSIVVKNESELWRFKCTFCRAEYKMDVFSCAHCGSTNVDDKDFLLVGDNQEFELASCGKCGRYYKIINKTRLKQLFPVGMEDFYTEVIDKIASEKGLVRLDNLKAQ